MDKATREPEIFANTFSALLTEYARRPDLHTFLDIGASDGRGSTAALYEGLKDRSDEVALYAMELREDRFKSLAERYKDVPFVHPKNYASVPVSAFPTEQDVRDFWRNFPKTPKWVLEQDLRNLRESREMQEHTFRGWTEGIRGILEDAELDHFDFVLIDGDHWLGEQELYRVMGAKVIALDDVQVYKNYNSVRLLGAHILYRNVHYNPNERDGYAVFERK